MIRKILSAAMIAASIGTVVTPADAAIIVRVAPPEQRVEVDHAARRGYAWTPGYWNWNGRRHVWVAGAWVRERPGYKYNHARWVERDGGWQMERRRWSKGDRDGDGVPNRFDRQPDNPRRN